MSEHENNLRLMAAALRRAQDLRRETNEAYWTSATRFTHDRLRAARRLAAALARHQRARWTSLEV